MEMEIIKDIAAAAVGISIVVWVLVCAVEVGEIWSPLKKQWLEYRMACD